MIAVNTRRLAYVHITWRGNEERLRRDPPSPALGQDDHDSAPCRQAQRYDYYRDIVHAAILAHSPDGARQPVLHLLPFGARAAVNADNKLRGQGRPSHAVVQSVRSECDIVSEFWRTLNESAAAGGAAAGWNLLHGAWPMMIGKAMQYGVPVDSRYMADPMKIFQSPAVLSVEVIYTQGVYFKARPLPQLGDLMQWWGIQSDNAAPEISRESLSSMTESEWISHGVPTVDKYLNGMAEIVENYYNQADAAPAPLIDRTARGPLPRKGDN